MSQSSCGSIKDSVNLDNDRSNAFILYDLSVEGYVRGNKHEETHCSMQMIGNGEKRIVYFNVLLLLFIIK